MVLKKCALCEKFMKQKSHQAGNGKLLADSIALAESRGGEVKILPESRICDKCRQQVCYIIHFNSRTTYSLCVRFMIMVHVSVLCVLSKYVLFLCIVFFMGVSLNSRCAVSKIVK